MAISQSDEPRERNSSSSSTSSSLTISISSNGSVLSSSFGSDKLLSDLDSSSCESCLSNRPSLLVIVSSDLIGFDDDDVEGTTDEFKKKI
ncbi:hypothetical protein DERP_009877 [Dermatophagoides pteronyssinus]|uniref:Uncharacterized protein n=1 Tax=Dermatophagoides pteronyssinus TaxID=6956 RepID=A0ABQ8J1X8_DERPT|nr:hypothetical protein DERP_009877 [Dermatophagoides pteronyssinus]